MNTQTMVQGIACPRCNVTNEPGRIFCANCGLFMADASLMVERATFTRRFFGSSVLEGVLVLFTLIIGWFIWLAFTAKSGQSPAKRLTNLYVINLETGRAISTGETWLREVVVKIIGLGIINAIIGVAGLIDAAFVLFDKNRQALHDKILKQVVVYAPRGLPESMLNQPGMYIPQPAYAQPMQTGGMQQMQQPMQQQPGGAPSSMPSATPGMSVAEQLRELARLHEARLLTDEEYERKRSELAGQL